MTPLLTPLQDSCAFATMTGDVGSVQASIAAGRAVLAEAGVLVNAVRLSRPHPDVYKEVI